MIGNKFLEAIVDIVKERHLKLLFVGDPFQLPPVVPSSEEVRRYFS